MQEVKITDLEPIVAPEPVLFWPPQPGWYAVLFLLFVGIGFIIYKRIVYKRRNAYRKNALATLKKLKTESFNSALVPKLNALLKATALQGYSRQQVANLSGDKWLDFLDKTQPKVAFSKTPGTYLEQLSYQALEAVQISAAEWEILLQMSEQWIKSHKKIQLQKRNL